MEPLTKTQQIAHEVLREKAVKGKFRPACLTEEPLNYSPGNAHAMVRKLKEQGWVTQVSRGLYKLKRI